MPAPTIITSALASSVNGPSASISGAVAIQTEVVSPESLFISLVLLRFPTVPAFQAKQELARGRPRKILYISSIR
jgi:hypothetical protein